PLPALVYKAVMPADEGHRQSFREAAHGVELRAYDDVPRVIHETVTRGTRHSLHRRESFRVRAGEVHVGQLENPLALAINDAAARARLDVSQSFRKIPRHVELRLDDDLARAVYVAPQVVLPDGEEEHL